MNRGTTVFMVCFVIGGTRGTNFPPVEHPVPIPGRAVEASLNPVPDRFLIGTNQQLRSDSSVEDNQRWFQSPFIGFLQDGNTPDSSQNIKEDQVDEFARISDDNASPVATPEPDEITVDSGDFTPDFASSRYSNPAAIALPSTDIWVGGKDASNQYTIQRWVPAPVPSDAVVAGISKNPPVTSQVVKSPPLASPPLQYFKGSPPATAAVVQTPSSAKQLASINPRIYTSLQTLFQNLPVPQQFKGNFPQPQSLQPPPPSPPSIFPQKTVIPQPEKSFSVQTPVTINDKGSEVTSLNIPVSPKVLQVQNGKAVPQPVVLNSKNSQPFSGWSLTPDNYFSLLKQVDQPSPKVPVASPVSSGKGIAVVRNVKGTTPVAAPPPPVPSKSYSFGEMWVLRQNAKNPYFERVRTLFSAPVVGTSKNLPTAIPLSTQSKSLAPAPLVPGKSVNPVFTTPLIGSVVIRRGNFNQKTTVSAPATPVIAPLPHSPKSDVLVIGKGSTIARLVPQTNGFLRSPKSVPISTKPCIVDNAAPAYSKGTVGVTIPQQLKVIPVPQTRIPKTATIQANRPYSYFIWNPNTRSNFYLLPQTVQKDVRPTTAILPTSAKTITQPVVPVQNKLQLAPLRYVRPISLISPGITDTLPGKVKNIESSNKGPLSSSSESPPPAENISSEESSLETNSVSKENKKEGEKESESPKTSSESSEEAETTLIERYEVAPDHIQQGSEDEPLFSQAPQKSYKPNTDSKVQSYAFGYDQTDSSGTLLHRTESSDTSGVVKGNYGFKDADGIYRNVDYIADNAGFRAKVHTNEQGVVSHNSANVNVIAEETANEPKSDQNVNEQVSSENLAWNPLRD